MIKIKKVEVTPVDTNYGKIIDSTHTSDDKTKNTYSMRAVEELIQELPISGIESKVDKSDFAVVFGQTDTLGEATVNYPQGFNKEETYVIGAKYKGTNSGSTGWHTSQRYYQTILYDEDITFRMNSDYAYQTVDFWLLLKKMHFNG